MRISDRRFALFLMAPAALFLAVFVAYPLFRLVADSFYKISPLAGGSREFVGLANYAEAFASEAFMGAGWRTLAYTLIVVTLEFALGLGMALLFTMLGKRSQIWRTVFLYPLMIAPIVAGLLWKFLMIDNFGLVGTLLHQAGILADPNQIGWLSDPSIVLFSVAIPDIWLTTSFMCLVLFAGLQNIPGDLIEAARLDGARAPALLFRIILPLLRPGHRRRARGPRHRRRPRLRHHPHPDQRRPAVRLRDHEPADLPDHDPLRRSRPGQRHGHHLPDRHARRRLRRRVHHLAARKGQLMSVPEPPPSPTSGRQSPEDRPGHSSVAGAASVASTDRPASGRLRRRRGRNREGLEAGKRSTRTLLWILLAAALVLYGFPFVYLLLTSFKTPIDTIAVPPTILPREWTLENYTSALGRSGVLASLINSVQTAIISTAALAGPGGPGRLRHHPVPDTQRAGLHHGRPGHPHGPAGRHRHSAGVHDGRRRAWRTPPSPCPSRTPPSRCRSPSG